MGTSGAFVGKNKDVDRDHSGDPDQDRMLLCIFAYVRQLRRPFFV